MVFIIERQFALKAMVNSYNGHNVIKIDLNYDFFMFLSSETTAIERGELFI